MTAGIERLAWFRSHAGYRLDCLTVCCLRLHRSGRRPDPIWEVSVDSFVPMIECGHRQLDTESAGR
jgi:hypothetical protein